MNSKSIMLALAVLLTTSASIAQYLVPGGQTGSGKPNNDPNRPGQYNPPPYNGGGPGHGGGGGYYPPPRPPGGGGGYYPPPRPPGGGGGYYPPPRPPGGGGGYYPPPRPPGGGGGYYPPPAPPYYPPPAPPYYPPAPPAPPAYGQRIVKQVYVGRSVENEMFQLSYYAGLSQYYGWEVTAVRATTRPNSPYRTVASLVNADRTILASQINPGYQIALYPTRTCTSGAQELYLWIEGSTFIETIEVELMNR